MCKDWCVLHWEASELSYQEERPARFFLATRVLTKGRRWLYLVRNEPAVDGPDSSPKESVMQNIHVSRYQNIAGYLGSIAPEDRSWIVFVDKDGEATFWRRFQAETEDGKTVHCYADAELPTGLFVREEEGGAIEGGTPTGTEKSLERDSLTFKVFPAHELGQHNAHHTRREGDEGRFDKNPEDGFLAMLDQRKIACWGKTEHEATTSLINYVVRLCVAGCLDDTGSSKPGGNPRRYRAAFGKPKE